ncbi:MAG: hypothetical protein J6C34_08075 [Oscillospiraceae bacterium]|nr:hypothetical protein [Oscillospiraceae bacterium]
MVIDYCYHPISFVKTKETEQSLRSAPSGRNSEQGLAPRSKYSRHYAAEYFGYRKSRHLKEKFQTPNRLLPQAIPPLKKGE